MSEDLTKKPTTRQVVAAISSMGPEDLDKLVACDTVQAIYAAFKWKLKIADYTASELADLLEHCVQECRERVKQPEVCSKAVAMFQDMRNKALEHLVEPKVDDGQSSNVAE